MHRANGLPLRIDSKSVRGIARCHGSLNMPCFSCLPRPRSLARSDVCYHLSCASICQLYILYLHVNEACHSSLSPSLTILLMSHTQPTSTPTSFQLIFDSALKTYKKRTNNDLLTHPLAGRLKACNSASSIRTVLQELVQELNESQRSNGKWLDPTVNVLLAFSETLGEGVGSVCFRT
jgi:hypothetical protein